MKDNVRFALIQPKPYPSLDDPRNLGHALQLLERCRGETLDIICFPEYFPYQGERELASAARQHRAYILAGLVDVDGDRVYNSATLFDRTGRLVGRQRKRNLGVLETENLGMVPGDGVFLPFETDFGKVGIPVCIDFWGQPEAGKQLVDAGAEIIFNISIFPILRDHWKTGALVRAFDNFVPVIGVNTADYNALFQGKRVHHHGGGSFVIQPPRMIDMDDFRRWVRGVKDVEDWIQLELDELEQVYFGEVSLSTTRRFRKELWRRFGLNRIGA